ncbi:MAG: hypothetical protein FWG08_03235 [Propionibacteriaceae bacterium]|nr:hypothetical protein [Propionibacteriaceae bacterium]
MIDFSSQLKRHQSWLVIYALAIITVGIASGIIWNRIVTLPAYHIGEGFRAHIPESGLAQLAATDVVFCFVGMIAGLLIGTIGWVLLKSLDWVVTLLAGFGGLFAGILALLTGALIGPKDFDQRIAQATPGDEVLVDFAAGTWVPLTLWVGVAVVPVLIGSLIQSEKWVSHEPADESSAPVEEESVE